MAEAYLIGGMRTPIGKKNGLLKNFLPEKLAALTLNGILRRYGLNPECVDAAVVGNVTGPGGNIGRVCLLEAGWPYEIPAFTIDAQCGSGLAAVDTAAAMIESGRADLAVAGGTESSSLAPRKKLNGRDPRFAGEDVYYEQAPFSPEWVGNPDIGTAAENLAARFGIGRLPMDELALRSHRRACLAQKKGYLKDIIVPVDDNEVHITADEGLRPNMSMKLLSRLKGAFIEGGHVTAGNSCLKHDGAAFVLLASEKAAAKYGLKPQARVYPMASAGCDPNFFPMGPVYAIRKLLAKYRIALQDIDAVEINEAFAVQIIACCRQLGMPAELVNQLGGAIAYGHPYGASGAVILLHLLQTLKAGQKSAGIASVGAVGGLGSAMLLKRI